MYFRGCDGVIIGNAVVPALLSADILITFAESDEQI